jgi:hypothetical protein
MGTVEIGHASIAAPIGLITEDGTRIPYRAGIDDANDACAAACSGSIVNRLGEGVGREKLQPMGVPLGEAQLQ